MNEEEYLAFENLLKKKGQIEDVKNVVPTKRTGLLDTLFGAASGKYDESSEDGIFDQWGYNYNKYVAEPIRDFMGSQNEAETPWYQPDKVTKNNKDYMVKNKIFTDENDLTDSEFQRLKHNLSLEKPEQGQLGPDTYYELEQDDLFKPGTATGSVQKRYDRNGLFNNFDVNKEVKTKNAGMIERLMHGRQSNLDKRVYDLGDIKPWDKNQGPLGESYTELYSDVKKTPVQELASVEIQNITKDNQYKQIAENLREKLVTTQGIKDMQEMDLDTLTKTLKKAEDENPWYEPYKGSINAELLLTNKAYQDAGRALNGLGFIDIPNDSHGYQFGEAMNEFASRFNNDISMKAKTLIDLANKPEKAEILAKALNAYNTTNLSTKQFIDGLINLGKDPTTWITGGGSGVAQNIAKPLARKTAIEILKSFSKKDAVQAAIAGGAWSGVDDAGNQLAQIAGKQQNDWNIDQSLAASGLGMVAGGLLSSLSKIAMSPDPKPDMSMLDDQLAKARKKIYDKQIPRPERDFYRREFNKIKEYKKKVNEAKTLAEQQRATKEFTKHLSNQLSNPENHPNIAKFYGLEQFENMKKKNEEEKLIQEQTLKDEYNKKRKDRLEQEEEVKPTNTKEYSTGSDGTKVEQTNKELLRQKTKEESEQYEISEPSKKRLEEMDKKNSYDEITLVDGDNNQYKALLFKEDKKTGTRTYGIERNNKIEKIEISKDGKTRLVSDEVKPTTKIETPLPKKMKPENLTKKQRTWLDNYAKKRKLLKPIGKKEAEIYERLMRESQSPRPGSNKWEVYDASTMPINYPGGEDAWKAVGERIRKYGKNPKIDKIESESDIAELNRINEEQFEVVKDSPYQDLPQRDKKLMVDKLWDLRSRSYADNADLLSMQSTKDQSAQFKKVTPKIESIDDVFQTMEDRIDNYNLKVQNEKQFGHTGNTEKKGIKPKDISKAQEEANRIEFIKQQLDQIKNEHLDNKDIIKYIEDLEQKLSEKKITQPIAHNMDKKAADKKYYDQIEIKEAPEDVKLEREYNLHENFNERKKILEDSGKYESVDVDVKNKVENNAKLIKELERRLKASEKKVKDAIVTINRTTDGRILNWDGTLSKKQRQAYPKEAKIIEQYRDLKSQLDRNLDSEELRYYELRRMEERLSDIDTKNIKTFEDVKQLIDNLENEFKAIGLTRKNTTPLREVMSMSNKDKIKDLENMLSKMEEIIQTADSNEARELKYQIEQAKNVLKRKEFNKKQNKGKPKTQEQINKERTRENSEKKQWKIKHDAVKKKVSYFRKHGYQSDDRIGRYKGNVANTGGEIKVTKRQREMIERGYLSDEDIASVSYPLSNNEGISAKHQESARLLAEQRIIKKEYRLMQKSLGIPIGKRIDGSPSQIVFKENIIDASNSAGQIIAVTWGRQDIGRMTYLGKNSVDGRNVIGEVMERNGMKLPDPVTSGAENKLVWKDFVKPLFMTEQYGQMDNGLVRTMMEENQWTREYSENFLKEYRKAADEVFPDLKLFRDSIYSIMKKQDFNGEISYTLPNGFKVEFEMKQTSKHKFTISGRDVEIELSTNNPHEMSRALMPNIIHSFDALLAEKMRKKGWDTNHDAFRFKRSMDQEKVINDYTDTLVEMLDMDLMNSTLKQLGFEGILPPVKPENKMTRQQIYDSTKHITMEHWADKPEDIKGREISFEYFKSEDDVMRDYMASSMVTQTPTRSLIRKMVNDSVYFDTTKLLPSDSVFERQRAIAQHVSEYDEANSIPVPEGVDPKQWDLTQRGIFEETRAKLEAMPAMRYNKAGENMLGGKRKYFDIKGNPIGKEIKTKSEILAEEITRGTQIRSIIIQNLTKRERAELNKIGRDYQTISKQVKSWSMDKPLDRTQLMAKSIVDEAQRPLPRLVEEPELHEYMNRTQQERNDLIEANYNMDSEYKSYLKRQLTNDDFYNQFNELHASKHSQDRLNASKEEQLLDYWRKTIPEELNDDILKHMLYTDIKSIDHLTKDQADQLMKKYKTFVDKYSKELDAMSKAIGRPENQIGFFMNGPEAMVKKYRLRPEYTQIIDQISRSKMV